MSDGKLIIWMTYYSSEGSKLNNFLHHLNFQPDRVCNLNSSFKKQ